MNNEQLNKIDIEGSKVVSGDRDQIILDHILKNDNKLNHANSHLGKNQESNFKFKKVEKKWEKTSKFRVALIMLPAWGIVFPPYNIAKIAGVLREFDYSTKVYDLNIESYHRLLYSHKEDYWRAERYFLWTIEDNFNKFILPFIEPLLKRTIVELLESNPKVIGFSVYNTNIFAVNYMVKEIKKFLPDVCIIAGGPEVMTEPHGLLKSIPFNYLFVGEAEENLINLLEQLPKEYPIQKHIGNNESKLKLESYSFADYTDYDLSNYQHPDGVSIETSRGCVAQCSFCAETYFWKFRSNTPDRVVEEMEHQIKLHGVKRFWFVDSLVNGNLKNFERLVDLIIEKKLNIQWNSYARCDGRMKLEFIQKIAESGCSCISYGIESGSQKVLLDMRKKIDIEEIENNLRDGYIAGLFTHVNWIVGFPTEAPIDFLHSLQLLANFRKSIGVISPGMGAGPAAQSHMESNWKEYGMTGKNSVWDELFLTSWYTTDYKNTILHRFIRIKLLHIWLEILKTHAESSIENAMRHSNVNDFFKLEVDNAPVKNYIKHDEFIDLDRLDSSELKNSLANEYFTIAYALYLYFGKFSLELTYDPVIDKSSFGDWLSKNYSSKFKISVDIDGTYSLKLEQEFIHDTVENNLCDKSFTHFLEETGNVNDWMSTEKQVKETVHKQYRKQIIPIMNIEK